MKIQNVFQVATHRLCLGCGVCVYACPEKKVRLIDILDDGIRPIITPGGCNSCDQCLQVCPGIETVIPEKDTNLDFIAQLQKQWGTVIEIWEGYAADSEIRFKGSSGGLCTALSLFCLKNNYSGGILHIGADSGSPLKNKTYLSTKKEELLRRTGSRYSPASPGDGLRLIETSSEPCVFVGKPCDVAGLRMAQSLNPGLDQNIGLAIGFFCAGTPSTQGTLDLLRSLNVERDEIDEIRYRGNGWPGMAEIRKKNKEEASIKVTYEESWGFVQKYRPYRCYLCPDLTGELADISVGDPWYREIGENDQGQSLILIRTEKGRMIFHDALKAGHIIAKEVNPDFLYRSQKNLLGKRQAIWGRIMAMKMLGIPYPKLEGFHLFENWLDLSLKEKVKSFLGTVRRVIQRNYFKPLDYSHYLGESDLDD